MLEVITDSVNLVLTNLGLLLIPLAVDLAYLGGREVNLDPAIGRVSDRLNRAAFTGSERLSELVGELSGVDVTGLLAMVLPTMFSSVDSGATYDPVVRDEIAIGSLFVALTAVALLFVLSAVIYGLFGAWLADVGLKRDRTWGERLRALPAISARIAGVFALGIGVVLLLCLPMLLAWGAASIAGIDLKGLFLPLVVILSTCLLVLFYFAPEAVFVSGASPSEALRMSSGVVRNNGWTTLGFIGATTLISWGLSDLWERLATNVPGLLLSMFGSAFAGCALALAAMKFFNERWLSLDKERAVGATIDGPPAAA